MEDLKILNNLNEIEDEFKNNFLDTVYSKTNIKINYEKKQMDYLWIAHFENTLLYIDNILRNPKRFIINEEEIVKVELAKKITVESVIHLTQHTNLIQDYDLKTGDVRPSKILNINKEESLDTYENRVIYTLIKNMYYFLEERMASLGKSYLLDEKTLNYNADVTMGSEKVSVEIKLNSFNKDVEDEKERLLMIERIKKIKIQIDTFMASELMKTLSKLHISPVRPPIRKTNVILKNPNFIKAMDLWNFLQNYDNKNFELIKDEKNYYDNGLLKNQFDETFLINYLTLKSLSKSSQRLTENKILSLTIEKMIETILENQEDITKKEFYEMVGKKFTKSKNKIISRDKLILDVLANRMNKFNKYLSVMCLELEE